MIDRREHRAFTMVELLVSLSVMSILVIGMASALTISVRSIPVDDAGARQNETAWTVDQMAAELAYAKTVTTATATDIEFTVDRGGTTVSIRYAWSGTAGDPLRRGLDGGALRAVVENVNEFDLGYDLVTVNDASDPPGIEGAEEIFLFQDSSNSGSGSNFAIGNNDKLAEVFLPDLPADAHSWRITRVKFIGNGHNPDNGTLGVSVRTTTGNGKPSNSAVEMVLVLESDLIHNQWHEVTFASAGGLAPDEPHCVAFTSESGGGAVAQIKTGTGSTGSPDTEFWFDDGGGTWSEDPTRDVWLWVAGTVTTPDPDWVMLVAALRSVTVTLNTGASASSRVRTSVTALNTPTFPGAP